MDVVARLNAGLAARRKCMRLRSRGSTLAAARPKSDAACDGRRRRIPVRPHLHGACGRGLVSRAPLHTALVSASRVGVACRRRVSGWPHQSRAVGSVLTSMCCRLLAVLGRVGLCCNLALLGWQLAYGTDPCGWGKGRLGFVQCRATGGATGPRCVPLRTPVTRFGNPRCAADSEHERHDYCSHDRSS